MKSYNVRVWKLRANAAGNAEVRWSVEGKERSRSFATKALADSFRSHLLSAAKDGEPFDTETGLPLSLVKQRRAGPSWFEHAVAYNQMKWARSAPNSRRSRAEALATIAPGLTRGRGASPDPKVLRAALYRWAFVPSRSAQSAPAEVRQALDWIRRTSVPVSALGEDTVLVRRALDALAETMDGRPAAATTARRKRSVFYNALRYAVERGHLPANPLDIIQWKMPEVAHEVDRRVVANPKQVRQLLAAVRAQGRRGEHLEAFFGCLYYAAMRPSEALDLREAHCILPERGWGRLDFDGSAPRVGADWTDSGVPQESRQLKWRARNAVRSVPIPPALAQLLRDHRGEYPPARDGRLFYAARGGYVTEAEYGQAWRKARIVALTPAQAASPLAARPYDLRHAGVSLWLRSGVDATEVARRAGHSVDVLLRIYAGVLDDTEHEANSRIEEALSDGTEAPDEHDSTEGE